MSVTCKGLVKLYGHTNAVLYEVKTNASHVYMSFGETTYMDRRAVSVVDARKFLLLWRASPYQLHKEIANGNIDTWKKDYKYHHAEKGFSQGIDNPVPLAEVNFESEGGIDTIWSRMFNSKQPKGHVSFTNGITRTIWLLCNGATSFPVEVSSANAQKLSKVAGVDYSKAIDIPVHDYFASEKFQKENY